GGGGWGGLGDGRGRGTPRPVAPQQVREVLDRTVPEPPPAGRDGWTTRTMASAAGLSQSAVSRIWRSAGLHPGSWRSGDAGDNEGVSSEQAALRQSGRSWPTGVAPDGTAADGARNGEPRALPGGRFLDRGEGWLRFNQRVLALA